MSDHSSHPTRHPAWRGTWGVVLFVLLGLGGMTLWYWQDAQPLGGGEHPLERLEDFGTVPAFALSDQRGQRVTLGNMAGLVWIANFIYTRCTDTYPLQSARLAGLHGEMADARDLRLVSISIDPAHDTPEALQRYTQRFRAHPTRWLFLTGDSAVIYRLARDGFHLSVVAPPLAQRTMGEGCTMMGSRTVWPSSEKRAVQPPVSSSGAAVVAVGQRVCEANGVVCHGLRGDGRGMAAHIFAMTPRDFRSGVFKFRSTLTGSLPRDADLLRVLHQGVQSTVMVPQTHLSEAEQRAVIAYLKTFSPRWQREVPALPVIIPAPPPTPPALLAQGHQVYGEAGCAQCHGPDGRGDGPQAAHLRDDWGWPIRPAKLQQRPRKSGPTLQDLYRTLAMGLGGTPMPAVGEVLSATELWALVYSMDSLAPPYTRMDEARPVGEEGSGALVEHMHGMMGRMPMMDGMRRRRPQEA